MPRITVTDLDDREDFAIDAEEFVLIGFGKHDGEEEPRIFSYSHAAPIFTALAAQILHTMASKTVEQILNEAGMMEEE